MSHSKFNAEFLQNKRTRNVRRIQPLQLVPACVPLCADKDFQARQFEYHPVEDILVAGSIEGDVHIVNWRERSCIKTLTGPTPKESRDSNGSAVVLALSFYKNTTKFLAGSSDGYVSLYDVDPSTSSQEDNSSGEVHKYGKIHDRLTSIHCNSAGTMFSTSGYEKYVSLHDLENGALIRTYPDIHEVHINICRFANHSPNLFVTCSFDKTVKLWDSRCAGVNPIFTGLSSRGNVMVCFSPDDLHFLTSAVDNEVVQYNVADGRIDVRYDLPVLNSEANYTRSYYSNCGEIIVSGAANEDYLRTCDSVTGKVLTESKIFEGRLHPNLFIQSLRGNPKINDRFAVLVFYRQYIPGFQMLDVDLNKTTPPQSTYEALHRGPLTLTDGDEDVKVECDKMEEMLTGATSSEIDPSMICRAELVTDYNKLIDSSKFSDVTFYCSDARVVVAHRIVIENRWPWFCKEFKDVTTPTISVKIDIPKHLFLLLLEYIYSAWITDLSWSNAIELYSLVQQDERFDFKGIKCILNSFLKERLSLSTALDLFNFTLEHGITDLQCVCVDFISRYLDWFTEHLKIHEKIPSSLFQDILKYHKTHVEASSEDLQYISGRMRFNVVKVGNYLYCIGGLNTSGPICLSSIPVYNLVTSGLSLYPAYGSIPESTLSNCCETCVVGTKIICYLGGFLTARQREREEQKHEEEESEEEEGSGGGEEENGVETRDYIYELETQTMVWTRKPLYRPCFSVGIEPCLKRTNFRAVLVPWQRKMYIYGGIGLDGDLMGSLLSYDLESDSHTLAYVPELGVRPGPRFGHTLTHVPNVGLIMIGGFTGNVQCDDRVYQLDLHGGPTMWQAFEIPPGNSVSQGVHVAEYIPIRSDTGNTISAVVCLGGRSSLIGGDGRHFLTDIRILDVTARRWREVRQFIGDPPPTSFDHVRAIALGSTLQIWCRIAKNYSTFFYNIEFEERNQEIFATCKKRSMKVLGAHPEPILQSYPHSEKFVEDLANIPHWLYETHIRNCANNTRSPPDEAVRNLRDDITLDQSTSRNHSSKRSDLNTIISISTQNLDYLDQIENESDHGGGGCGGLDEESCEEDLDSDSDLVVFLVEGHRIVCSKLLLSLRCEQFRLMFESKMMESRAQEILIEDVKVRVFVAMLKYIYSSQTHWKKVDSTESSTVDPKEDIFSSKQSILDIFEIDTRSCVHSLDLLVCANRFQLDSLSNVLEREVARTLKPENVCDILKFAEFYTLPTLTVHARNFLVMQFGNVSQESILQLDSDTQNQIMEAFRAGLPQKVVETVESVE